MKIKYKISIFAIAIILIAIAIHNFYDSQLIVEQKYDKNKEQFGIIIEYLDGELFRNQDIIRIDVFDSISKVECEKEDKTKGEYNRFTYYIEEKELLNALEILEKKGLVRILKEYDCLYFQFKSSFVKASGIVYSPNGEPILKDSYLHKSEIKETKFPGWYYYKFVYEE